MQTEKNGIGKLLDRRFLGATVLVIMLLFGLYIRGYSGLLIEVPILEGIQGLIPASHGWPYFITAIGNTSTYFAFYIALLAICYHYDRMETFVYLLLSTLVAFFLMEGFKALFVRIRPQDFMRITQGGYSYPSGHSAVSMATWLTASRLPEVKAIRGGKLSWGFAAMPLLIGFTRLILGVHWPTDVLLGWALGWAVSINNRGLYQWIKKGNPFAKNPS
ncbi:MAG: phosphatase PAP2 family protein [Tissierellia bacterium]|nr:phosphatase PAP2 family protein [Tissierellia bacterium]